MANFYAPNLPGQAKTLDGNVAVSSPGITPVAAPVPNAGFTQTDDGVKSGDIEAIRLRNRDTTGYGSDYDPHGSQQLHSTHVGMDPSDLSASKRWLTNAQNWEQTRNNYYYGGYQGGASDFNQQIANANAGQSDLFNLNAERAATFGLNAGQIGKQMGATQQWAAGRDPQAFIDSGGMANNDAGRANQAEAIYGLNRFIKNGPGPSAAQAQLNMATDANMNNTLALARSGRGLGQSQAGMRQAIGQNAQTQQMASNQAAVLRAQEAQAWQQTQLGAYGQIGNIAGAARQGDLGASSYLTGSAQAGQNANDQTGLAYAGLQRDYGQQQLGALGQQLSANQSLAQSQNAALGLQNNVNGLQMQGNSGYEQNSQNYYLGQQQANGTDYSPFLAAGGAIAGALVGGPAGAAAGGALGNAAGKAAR